MYSEAAMASGSSIVQWYQTETTVTASIRLSKSEAVRPQFEARRCAVYVGGKSFIILRVGQSQQSNVHVSMVLKCCSKELALQ